MGAKSANFHHEVAVRMGYDAEAKEVQRLYLSGAKQEAGPADALWQAMTPDLGLPDQVGKPVELRGLSGSLRRLRDKHALVRLTDPYPGYAALWCGDTPQGGTFAQAYAYLFHPDAENYVEREQPGWKAWLGGLEESA